MNSGSILPPNATRLEKALEQVEAQRLDALEINLRALWDPYECPTELLPWLAWAESLDMWREDWSEEQKRNAIAASQEVHETKGTPYAVKRGLAALGYQFTLTEWFQVDPPAQRGTFGVEIEITDNAVTAPLLQELLEVINSTKRGSSHLWGLTYSLKSKAVQHIASATVGGSSTTVYPAHLLEAFSMSNTLHAIVEHDLYAATELTQ